MVDEQMRKYKNYMNDRIGNGPSEQTSWLRPIEGRLNHLRVSARFTRSRLGNVHSANYFTNMWNMTVLYSPSRHRVFKLSGLCLRGISSMPFILWFPKGSFLNEDKLLGFVCLSHNVIVTTNCWTAAMPVGYFFLYVGFHHIRISWVDKSVPGCIW